MTERKSPWGGKKSDDPAEGAPAGGAPADGSAATGDKDGASEGPGEPAPTPPPSGPRNPWKPSTIDGGKADKPRSATIEDLFRPRGPKGPKRGGGGGGFSGLPPRADGKSWWPIIIGGVALLWLALSCIHRISPQEKGVVVFLGSYSRTLGPGVNFTMPWPLETVIRRDVQNIRTEDIPKGEAEKLILTSDQNLIDLAYSVRWNIKDLKQFEFELAEPEETIREVAEAAMRASVAEVSLDDAIGPGRTDLELRVQQRMQELLDSYKAGVLVQGVAIKKADPPEAVNDAFKQVSASQQQAQTYLNEARAYAQQLTARAQGDAASFDKVYAEYRLAPGVTRQRMYYETMERVLSKVDKTIVETPGLQAYLPLPEVRRRARETAVAAGAPSVTVGEGQ